MKTKDVSLSLWDSVLVRKMQERCPNNSRTLSASYKNVVPDWQESSAIVSAGHNRLAELLQFPTKCRCNNLQKYFAILCKLL